MQQIKTMPFNRMVEFLDKKKTQYYQLQYCIDHGHELSAEMQYAKKAMYTNFTEAARVLRSFPTLAEEWALMAFLRHEPCTEDDSLEVRLAVDMALDELKERFAYTDDTFYHDGGFGKFWNEVELPPFIGDFFDAFTYAVKGDYDGMLGPEEAAGKQDIPDGACMVSFYDLSDIGVVFRDAESADRFCEHYGVDPSDFLYWVGNGWQS